ncbi:hypothetical protein GCM10007935_00970 [Hydrogenophaga electricum]|uniref:Uncharacterized protein n=1 Tax=Hydrogenophaga electricum TaxID=1230953 RepID=A0ABQ6BWY3_9BURK|nr:hypothetical protein GCM10007935_00970 [Hydrogenophaga electricum]
MTRLSRSVVDNKVTPGLSGYSWPLTGSLMRIAESPEQDVQTLSAIRAGLCRIPAGSRMKDTTAK